MYKQSINSKFLIQIKFFFICFFITLQSLADDTASQKNLIYIGSNDAKVKIKVFSSFTCPHCADFHLNIVSKIEKEFVFMLTTKRQQYHIDSRWDGKIYSKAETTFPVYGYDQYKYKCIHNNDPYLNEPIRDSQLIFHQVKPCNAETPPDKIMDNWITPNHL